MSGGGGEMRGLGGEMYVQRMKISWVRGIGHRVVLRTSGDETFEDGFCSSEYSTVFRRCLYYIALYCLVDALDGELCIYIGETLSIFFSRK